MKIGDKVFVHGYVDEIRKDIIIIRNEGGYFGTVPDEILPSAQPERKTGRWVPVTNGRGGHECDKCHEYAPSWTTGEEHLTNYCPHCGADMRGGES